MDDRQFDDLTKFLSPLPSRRDIVRLLAGALGGGVAAGAVVGWEAAPAKRGRRKKGRRKKSGGGGSASTCKVKVPACTSDDFCRGYASDLCVGGQCIEDLGDRLWRLPCDEGCNGAACHGGFCRPWCDPDDPRDCTGECVPDGDAGYCLECTGDAHCSRSAFFSHCVDHFCEECGTDAHCPVSGEGETWLQRPGTPRVCRGAGCHPSCASDAECETSHDIDHPHAKPLAYSCVNGACVWNRHKEGCAYGFQGGGVA